MANAAPLAVLLAFAAGCAAAAADEPKPDEFKAVAKDPAREKALASLRARITEILKPVSGVTSIWFKDLGTGDMLTLRPDRPQHPASTIKTPIMAAVLRDVEAGKYDLDREIPVHDTFPSAIDGSLFKTDGGEEILKAVGKTMKLRRVIEHMIHTSDNLATNLCTETAGGAKAVSAALKELGMKSTVVARYITDQKAYNAGLSSTTTAADMGDLYERISRKQVVSPKACDTMIEILLGQEHNRQIPAGLPAGTKVAHKTGWFRENTSTMQDDAIVFLGDRTYVLSIKMAETKSGDEEDDKARKAQVEISKAVYEELFAKPADAAKQ